MSEKSRKTIRVPEDLDKQLEAEIEKTKNSATPLSENDVIVNALRHYFTCTRLEPQQQMRLMVLMYPAKCLFHKDETIPAGSWALYGRGVGAICMDAYVQRMGDKTLVAKYLKMRDYEQLIKALKSEADRIADKVEIFGLADKWENLLQGATKVRQLIMDYLTKGLGTDEEKRVLEEMVRLEEKQTDLVRQIESFLEKQTLRAKKQVKQAPYEA